MNVSEGVLFSTLAQIGKKDAVEAAKKIKQEQKAFEIVKNEPVQEKVNILKFHEGEIIKILLQFGMKKDEFLEFHYEENDEGELELKESLETRKVAEKIYLELQQDEIEFADETFKKIYNIIIESFISSEEIEFSQWISTLPQEMSQIVVDLDMDENKYSLHDWERREIYVRSKDTDITLRVSQTITSVRLKLINDLIEDMAQDLVDDHDENKAKETLENIRDYNELKINLAKRNGLL